MQTEELIFQDIKMVKLYWTFMRCDRSVEHDEENVVLTLYQKHSTSNACCPDQLQARQPPLPTSSSPIDQVPLPPVIKSPIKLNSSYQPKINTNEMEPSEKQKIALSDKDLTKPGNWRSILSCCLICMGGFSQGVIFGWYPFILSGDAFIESIPTSDTLQLASMSNLGAALGSACSGPLTRLLPTHRLVPLLSLASALSWLLVSVSSNMSLVIAGRALTGLFVTCQAAISPKYIALLSPDNLKGTLLSAFSISRNMAQLILIIEGILGNFYGNDISWQMKSHIFGFGPAILLFLAFPLLTEEGAQNKSDTRNFNAALTAIGLGGGSFTSSISHNKNIGHGCSVIKTSVLAAAKLKELNQKKEELKEKYGSGHVSVQYKKKTTVMKRTVILLALGTGLSFSGIQPLTSFPKSLIPGGISNSTSRINSSMEEEEWQMDDEPIYPYTYYWASFSFLMSQLLGSIICPFIIDRIGHRLVLIISSFVLVSCNFAMAAYYYLDNLCIVGSGYCYIPIIVFALFALAIGTGLGTIFTVMVGDSLPLVGQPVTIPVVYLWINLMNYVGNSVFNPISDITHGLPAMFLFHAMANFFIVILFCFINIS